MRVATANICNLPDMPRRKVREDAAEVAPHADVILFQEIHEAEDHEDVRRALGPGFVLESFGGNPNPIAYRPDLVRVVGKGVHRTHRGLAKTSGPRYVTWIETADGVVYMNTHFVSGAWNRRADRNDEWRRARWLEHYSEMRDLVQRFRARGLTVVFGGDFNRQVVAKFDPSQIWVVNPSAGIDKIGVVPATGATFKVQGRVKVLDLNSDHHARIVDVVVTPPLPAGFKAATWNVFYGTPVRDLRPILRDLKADGVSLILFQEISNPDVRAMIEEEGYRLFFAPRQYGIAFLPDVWEGLSKDKVRLSETNYFRKDGKTPQHSEAVHAVLRERASGRTLDVVSYHTPAHVQPDLGASVPRRLQALRESMATLKALADAAKTTAVLYGGDDNVDEFTGNGSKSGFWRFMLRVATGLRQIQAPSATHGRVRKIDDFRIRRLKVGEGYVRKGGGDHRVHVREFRWRK